MGTSCRAMVQLRVAVGLATFAVCSGGHLLRSAGLLRQEEGLTSISPGYQSTCYLHHGCVYCWGDNAFGQLGIGSTTSIGDDPNEMGSNLNPVDLDIMAQSISVGDQSACAVSFSGALKCWGWFPALGQGDQVNKGTSPEQMGSNLSTTDLGEGEVVQEVSMGVSHACARLGSGHVKCWGANIDGILGNGRNDNSAVGLRPGEMGDNLLAVELGAEQTVEQICSSYDHNCVVLNHETEGRGIKCWGRNLNGELGLGDDENRGTDASHMGDNLTKVDLGAGDVDSISCGRGSHNCAVFVDGTAKCWGENAVGQLGQGDTSNRGDQPGELGDTLQPIDLGQNRLVQKMIVGVAHTCALLDNGAVKCWGRNFAGELGYGDKTSRGDGPMGDTLPEVDLGEGRTAVDISAWTDHTCAKLDDGNFKCWGMGRQGQLGNGNEMDVGDDADEMGDHLPNVEVADACLATLAPTPPPVPTPAPSPAPTPAPTTGSGIFGWIGVILAVVVLVVVVLVYCHGRGEPEAETEMATNEVEQS